MTWSKIISSSAETKARFVRQTYNIGVRKELIAFMRDSPLNT